MDFTDKVVIITGASSGIGATCSVHFARLSAKLTIVGRNVERLNDVAKQCEDIKGVKPLIVKADLNVDTDVTKIVDDTLKRYGRIDVLINNAGLGAANVGLTDGIEHYEEIMSTNVRSVYLLTSRAIQHLIMSTGNIVNVSSVAAVRPLPDFLPYCMSKAALDMFTKCVAREFACDGVRVNSVNPGPVKTNFHESAGMSNKEIEAYWKNRLKASPLGKISTTEDVAELIVFLASDKAKSITGCIHFVDNGILLGT